MFYVLDTDNWASKYKTWDAARLPDIVNGVLRFSLALFSLRCPVTASFFVIYLTGLVGFRFFLGETWRV